MPEFILFMYMYIFIFFVQGDATLSLGLNRM